MPQQLLSIEGYLRAGSSEQRLTQYGIVYFRPKGVFYNSSKFYGSVIKTMNNLQN